MEFQSVIEKRYSCRSFQAAQVPTELLKQCVEAGRKAPSAGNIQPWRFHIVNNPQLKQEIATMTQPFAKNASFIVIEEVNPPLRELLAFPINIKKFTDMDIGVACAYICLQAAELGLNTCMVVSFNEVKIKKLLSIPNQQKLRMLICVGYAAEDQEERYLKRKSMEQISRLYE